MSMIRVQSHLMFGVYGAPGASVSIEGCAGMPAQDTRKRMLRGAIVGAFPLPTDPIGTMQLALTNVVPGSTYDIEVQSTGALITSGTISGTSASLSIPVYQPGSPSNTIRVKIRKGSASPYYQPYETQAIAAVGAQSIYINQLPDE